MRLLCIFAVLSLAISSHAQQADKDTVDLQNGIRDVRDSFHDKEEFHSPHKATFYSAILPGLGQAYNKKYWKIPILYAGIGAMGYAIHFNSTNYIKYKNAYRDFLIRDPGNKSYKEVIPPTLTIEEVENTYNEWFQRALQNKREYYKRYRDLSYIGMAAIYILNLIDATVDAHFYNFDVSDDLSMDIRPAMLEPGPASIPVRKMGVQLSLNF
jgi:hypothetical protein